MRARPTRPAWFGTILAIVLAVAVLPVAALAPGAAVEHDAGAPAVGAPTGGAGAAAEHHARGVHRPDEPADEPHHEPHEDHEQPCAWCTTGSWTLPAATSGPGGEPPAETVSAWRTSGSASSRPATTVRSRAPPTTA